MKTAAQKIEGFSNEQLEALGKLATLRTETPATRADCEQQIYFPCTAFSCKFNLTTEIALRKPNKALGLVIQGIKDSTRNNCLLDHVVEDNALQIPQIAEILLMTEAKTEAVLRGAIRKAQETIYLDDYGQNEYT